VETKRFAMNASVLQVETKRVCDECERIAGGDGTCFE